jgi:predicted permease
MWARLRGVVVRIRNWWHDEAEDRGLLDELETHISLLEDRYRRRGHTDVEARRLARHALGGTTQLREAHRDARGLPFADAVAQDVRHAARVLRKAPGFTAFVVLIVALGIGMSTTIFSVVHAVLLRPLPFDDPVRLVWIENDLGPTESDRTIQVGHLIDLQRTSSTFSAVAGYEALKRGGDHTLVGTDRAVRVTTVGVTRDFFPVLGVRPSIGRLFTAAECEWNAPHVVLLSHALWQRDFDAAPDVVGRSLTVDGAPSTVVGVLPASFDFSIFEPGARVDLFVPYPLSAETNRRGNTMYLVGRLAPGTTLPAARAAVQALASRSAAGTGRNRFLPRLTTLRDHVSGTYRLPLAVLAGGVALVLGLVCANVSSLLLVRATARRREMAVRASLGAGRGRLIRQALTEPLLLSAAGGALGTSLATLGTRLLARLEALQLPLRHTVDVDPTVLTFALLSTVAVGLGAGVLPALRITSSARCPDLREGARGMSDDRRTLATRHVLMAGEIALACILLVGAGLLTRSFARVLAIDLGFEPRDAIALRVDPGLGYSDAERTRQLMYFDELLGHVRAVGDVEAAGLTDSLPLGHNRVWSVTAAGRVPQQDATPNAYVHMVSEAYFRSMGIPLLRGRDFTAADDRVIIVNETLARGLWPDGQALHHTAIVGGIAREVIGVARDVRLVTPERSAGPEMYLPVRQEPDYSAMYLVVRGNGSTSDMPAVVRQAVTRVDASPPLSDVRFMQDVVDEALSPRRLVVVLFAGFGGFALTLACLGVYGVVSYSITWRSREFGIRMALGASARRLTRAVAWQTLRLAATGLTVGLAGAWCLALVMRGLLFGVTSTDPVTFGTVIVLLAGVAVGATFLPARRISRIDPAVTLRDGAS